MNKRLQELKIEVDKLKQLLDDPQPGLASCVYLWMLIKAKKQGVCPYFIFSDKK
jgi:hypothetical protein